MEENRRIKLWYVMLVAFVAFPLKFAGYYRYLAYLFVYGYALFYLLVNVRYVIYLIKKASYKEAQLFKLIYIYLFGVSLIWPIALSTYDFTYVSIYWVGMLLWTIKYLFLVVVFEKKFDTTSDVELFFEYFINAVSLYAFVSLVAALVSPIRNIMFKIIYLDPMDIERFKRPEYRTRFGWTGWSGFNETTICSIAVLILCLLILKYEYDIKKQKKYLIKLVFPLIGNALFGRTGFLVSLCCIGVTCICVFFKRNIKLLIRMILIGIILIFLIGILKDKIEVIQTWYNWVFSVISNYRRYGKFYDSMGTVQHLTNDMYWMPSIGTLLYGDGRYTDAGGGYYLHTDSGIMRTVLYYGVFHYFIALVGVILLFKRLTKKIMLSQKKNKFIVCAVLYCMIISIFEFKGESIWMMVGIIFPAICLSDNNLVKNDSGKICNDINSPRG